MERMMLVRLAFKTAWTAGKLTVKYVVIPVAYTAALAAVASYAAERIREGTPDPNGKVDTVIKAKR